MPEFPLFRSRLRLDPRLYQIATLSALLVYGILALDFDFDPLRILAIVGSAQVWKRIWSN